MTDRDGSTHPVFAVGGRFRNWRIERVIGEGGMGTVFLARHDLVGRLAAIKVLRGPGGARQEDAAISRFHVETELHVTLRHPNLPDFFDAEMLPDGTAVLVLEYLDGYDLATALARVRKLAIGDALFVATEVLRALMIMHATSVHRDVKPSNVFLCRRPRLDSEGRLEKGRVRLLDFGIAKLKGRKGPTRQFSTIGTNSYMSPEQLLGKEVDGRSDLYALGAVLYEAIAGHPVYVPDPADRPTADAIHFKHIYVRAPDLRDEMPEAPADVCEFVARLLEKAPENRFDSTEDALNLARSLRRRHREDARLFREDVDDVVAAIDALREERWSGPAPVENPMRTDPMGHPPFTGEADASPRGGAPTDAAAEPPPQLTRRGTFRMTAPTTSASDGVEPGDQRNVERVRELIRGPRCFLIPTLTQIDSLTHAPIGTFELTRAESVLGSSNDADLRVRAAGIDPRHARVSVRRDRRLEIRLVDTVNVSAGALCIDGVSSPWGGQVLHGATLAIAGATLVASDRAVTSGAARRRPRPATLSAYDATGARTGTILSLERPLTLAGASSACDLVVAGVADVCAALWLRGDGRFELVELDTSVLPHGDPILSASILRGSTRLALPNGGALVLDDPISDEGTGRSAPALDRSPAEAAPIAAAPHSPRRAAGATMVPGDKLVVCGKRSAGLRGELMDSYDVPHRKTVIGSDKRCDIVIDHDWVSPRHAELSWIEPGRYFVRDLGSKRGTFVNRKKVASGAIVHGDYVDLGGAISLQYERGLESPPERPAPERGIGSLLRRIGIGKDGG